MPVRAATDCAAFATEGPADLLIVLVKSFHTAEAMASARCLIGPQTVVLSLQNGLGHEDLLAPVVGREALLAGKTYVGGDLIAPGHVSLGYRGKDTHIGEFDGRLSPRLRQVAQLLRGAGLQVVESDNILGTLWDKLFINVATGALTAITGLGYGPLYRASGLQDCGVAAVAEAMAVARAAGVRCSLQDPLAAWRKAGAGLPDYFRTSMLQSLDKGSITEVNFVNGAVVREGERLGVPTPVNRTLLACVHGLEQAQALGLRRGHTPAT